MKKFKKQEIKPDDLHDSILVSRFINQLMKGGKKHLAKKIVYRAFEIIKKETKKNPLEIFEEAIENASPDMEVRPQRVGGATYQVPRGVRGERRNTLAMRWIIGISRNHKGSPMEERLAKELILASKNEGEAVKKKINIHKMAQANKAFAYLAK